MTGGLYKPKLGVPNNLTYKYYYFIRDGQRRVV